MKLGPVKRVILAAVLSPLAYLIVHPLVWSIGTWVNYAEVADMSGLFSVAPHGLYVVYPFMLVFVLPVYLVLWRLGITSIWACGAVGLTEGVLSLHLASYLFDLFFSLKNGSIGPFLPTAALWGFPMLGWFGVEGMLLGMAFWSIARPDLNPRKAKSSAPLKFSHAGAAQDDDVINRL